MTRTNAVILAGGKASEEIQQLTGVTNRALIPIGGRPMLDYVVDALAESTSVGDIVVVGDVPSNGRFVSVRDKGSLLDNLVAGLTVANTERCLVSTSDIPFLTPAAVDDFVERASARDVDIAYPIVEMGSYREKFGDMKRTTVKLKEGVFTGGNMMLLRTQFILGQTERIRQAYAARKDVLKLASMFGPGMIVRLLVSQTIAPSILSLPSVEAAAGRLLGPGSRVAAVSTSYPEIGTDVDKPEDVEVARRLLGASTVQR